MFLAAMYFELFYGLVLAVSYGGGGCVAEGVSRGVRIKRKKKRVLDIWCLSSLRRMVESSRPSYVCKVLCVVSFSVTMLGGVVGPPDLVRYTGGERVIKCWSDTFCDTKATCFQDFDRRGVLCSLLFPNIKVN